MAGNTVEICANCGKINKEEAKDFVCPDCGCNVSVILPVDTFRQMVEEGLAKE
jgi:predicted RNA-binding Zn-ribbon protein involved in translation (DUF1610 family)